MGAQAFQNLRVGNRLQGFSVADGHQLDKTYVQLMVFRKLRQGDTFHIVDAPLENGVDLDRNPRSSMARIPSSTEESRSKPVISAYFTGSRVSRLMLTA